MDILLIYWLRFQTTLEVLAAPAGLLLRRLRAAPVEIYILEQVLRYVNASSYFDLSHDFLMQICNKIAVDFGGDGGALCCTGGAG